MVLVLGLSLADSDPRTRTIGFARTSAGVGSWAWAFWAGWGGGGAFGLRPSPFEEQLRLEKELRAKRQWAQPPSERPSHSKWRSSEASGSGARGPGRISDFGAAHVFHDTNSMGYDLEEQVSVLVQVTFVLLVLQCWCLEVAARPTLHIFPGERADFAVVEAQTYFQGRAELLPEWCKPKSRQKMRAFVHVLVSWHHIRTMLCCSGSAQVLGGNHGSTAQ